MTEPFDTIVVGGGLAGSFFTIKMARAGKKVLLLEARERPKRKVCGEYLCPQGVNLLKEEGLFDELVAHNCQLSISNYHQKSSHLDNFL